ncbi:hypothetical protein HMPREF9344_00648 [Cutibacterium acnes HL097PA1]|nr:hypothetical protein HMPREF9344_00648 [Cutibacterium acnes HL097PA1]
MREASPAVMPVRIIPRGRLMSHRPGGDVRISNPIWNFCPCRGPPNYAETGGR